MADPKDRETYDRLIHENTRITGYGADVATILPCPFCGAADWLRFPITAALTEYRDVRRPTRCRSCKRTAQILIERQPSGGIAAEFVQTDGPDPAPWLTPAPRRIKAGPTREQIDRIRHDER